MYGFFRFGHFGQAKPGAADDLDEGIAKLVLGRKGNSHIESRIVGYHGDETEPEVFWAVEMGEIVVDQAAGLEAELVADLAVDLEDHEHLALMAAGKMVQDGKVALVHRILEDLEIQVPEVILAIDLDHQDQGIAIDSIDKEGIDNKIVY